MATPTPLDLLLDDASRRGEATIAMARLALAGLLLVRMFLLHHPRILAGEAEVVIDLFALVGAMAFSAWTLAVVHRFVRLHALLLVSAIFDAALILGLHAAMVAFAPGFDGVLASRHLAASYLAVFALAARLVPRVVVAGTVAQGVGLAGVLAYEDAHRADLTYDLATLGPHVTYLLVSALIAWSLARRTRELVLQGALAAARAERARQHLGAYVSEAVAARALSADSLALGGIRQPVAVLFSDLRGFTRHAEHLPPEDLVGELNAYFEVMVGVVRAHGGVVDKFIGDGVMAVFGVPEPAPDDAARAIRCAHALQEALEGHNRARRARGLAPLAHGVGVHYGPVVAGNIGAAERLQYTVIGDVVNVASRLESATKAADVRVLVSADAVAAARASGVALPPLASHPPVSLRGRSGALEVYALDRITAEPELTPTAP